jgi:hypothetical protein
MAWGDSSYLDKEISGDAFGRFFRPIEERQEQLAESLKESAFARVLSETVFKALG